MLTILMIAAIIAALLIYVAGYEKTWASIFGSADQGRTVFKTLRRSKLPNTALICPQDYCDTAKPNQIAPLYSVSAEQLREKFRAGLKQEKNLERVHTNDPAMRERYIQRSSGLRFPDTIQVEYIPLSAKSSTIALYSQSQIGISDRGVNAKRLRRWLKIIEDIQAKTS